MKLYILKMISTTIIFLSYALNYCQVIFKNFIVVHVHTFCQWIKLVFFAKETYYDGKANLKEVPTTHFWAQI